MSYQPLRIKKEYFEKLMHHPIDVLDLYNGLDLNGVERCCIDRLVMIINETRVNQIKNPTVLDLGSSGGFFCAGLAYSIATSVTGVDDDRYIKIQGEDQSSSITETRKRMIQLGLKNVTLYDCAIEKFLFSENCREAYDVVLCLNILHHFYKGYGNLTLEGKLSRNLYIDVLKRIGEITRHMMIFETDAKFFPNYEEALLEVFHYGGFKKLSLVGSSPAANGELRILWNFQK